MSGTLLLVEVLPAARFWHGEQAYKSILGFAPRLAVASMAAYFAGEFSNSWVLSRRKYQYRRKYAPEADRELPMAWRFVASTIVGEAVDSIVVLVIGFTGVLTLGQMVEIGGSLYVFKVAYEVVALPLSLPVARWVKRIEGVDKVDIPEETDYNPFAVAMRWKRRLTP